MGYITWPPGVKLECYGSSESHMSELPVPPGAQSPECISATKSPPTSLLLSKMNHSFLVLLDT